MSKIDLLNLLIYLPLIGAIFILFFIRNENKKSEKSIYYSTLFVTIATFILSVMITLNFDFTQAGFQFVKNEKWFVDIPISYHIGIDGLSLALILLTTSLLPICILASKDAIKTRVKEYMVCFLVLETFIIGTFSALDLVLFYVFFEAMLVPMYLIIGIWGGKNRIYAAYKFFLYTLAGSVLLLLAIIYIYLTTASLDVVRLPGLMKNFPLLTQQFLWLALFASFAVKIPMWPVHTWLPDAHVEAPTAGSVILAGVLLKMGAYGFLRFSLPMLPLASLHFANMMHILSIIAIIYASIVALMQEDMKKLIAYSSVAHMGFVTIGIFSFNEQGVQGAIIQMMSHGYVSAALFLCVGVMYNRMHTREIAKYGGLVQKMPFFAFMMMIFTLASAGLPGTSGFVGEFLALAGIYQISELYALLAASSLVFGAAYILYLYRNLMFLDIKNKEIEMLADISILEKVYMVPMAIIVVFLGVYPSILTNMLQASVAYIVGILPIN